MSWVGLSVDDEPTTGELIAKHGLEFSEATGAFVNDDPLFAQSAGFVLNPGGQVIVSFHSTCANGRPLPEDVIGVLSSRLIIRVS